MKKQFIFVAAALCALAVGGGCTLKNSKSGSREGMRDGAHPQPEGRGARGASSNGSQRNGKAASAMAEIIVTNGASINGPLISGKAAPGSEIHGRNVAGTSAGGSALSGITLQGSGLTTVRVSDGAVLSGAALIGAKFATHMPDRSRITLRVDAHSATPSDHHAGRRAYAVNRSFINIFDKLGIQDDTADWSLESEWDANGARCLSRPRLEGGPAPDCAFSKCEASPDWGNTLVVTEAP